MHQFFSLKLVFGEETVSDKEGNMAKAKASKSASKAKPAAKKAASVKKSAPAKKSAAVKKTSTPVKKQAVPAKKTAAKSKKPAPSPKKTAAAQPAKKMGGAIKKPVTAPVQQKLNATPKSNASQSPKSKVEAPVVASPAAKPVSAANPHSLKGAQSAASPLKASPPVNKPIKAIPIPSEVLKLKDKTQMVDGTTTAEKREIHQSDIFSEDELRMFLEALNSERASLLDKARAAVDGGNIALDKDEMYDEVDLASATVDQNLTFRLLDRDRKLLGEIDHAIQKIQTGEFGYCEGTGEPIPKRRLELRPWCRHSVKYKEQLEKLEKSGRGVVDEDAELLD
jgi:DnaK suppressor protein